MKEFIGGDALIKGQWHNMGITFRTLRTLLEKRPSGNEQSIGKLHKLHGVIEAMFAHHGHDLYIR